MLRVNFNRGKYPDMERTQVAIIWVGGNDLQNTGNIAQMKTDYNHLIHDIHTKHPHMRFIIISITPRQSTFQTQKNSNQQALSMQLALTSDTNPTIITLNIYKMMLTPNTQIATSNYTLLYPPRQPHTAPAPDLTHLSTKGLDRMKTPLIQALRKFLPKNWNHHRKRAPPIKIAKP